MIEILRLIWYDFPRGGVGMKRTENAELTVLCLIYGRNKILLQNRVKADWKGYALPGGHVEPGESIVDAVIREMKEETGLTISRPRLCGVKQFPIDGGRYIVFLFKTDCFEGELVSSHEGKMEWVRRDRIRDLKTVAHLEELLRVMESSELNEFQYVIDCGEWIPVLR
jgi:8-oxo-dGTP diphosphatase